MTRNTAVINPELTRHLESVAVSVRELAVPFEPAVSLKAEQHPGALVRLVATPIGLLRLAAHIVAHVKDGSSQDQHESFERIYADDSASLVIDVVDAMPLPPSSRTPSRIRAGLWTIAMMGLWASSLVLWAIGLYVSVMWVGARLMPWW